MPLTNKSSAHFSIRGAHGAPSMSELARPRKATQDASAIIVINCGSSSVKFALFAAGQSLSRLRSGSGDRIGLANGHFHIADADGVMIAYKTGFFLQSRDC